MWTFSSHLPYLRINIPMHTSKCVHVHTLLIFPCPHEGPRKYLQVKPSNRGYRFTFNRISSVFLFYNRLSGLDHPHSCELSDPHSVTYWGRFYPQPIACNISHKFLCPSSHMRSKVLRRILFSKTARSSQFFLLKFQVSAKYIERTRSMNEQTLCSRSFDLTYGEMFQQRLK